MSQLVLLMFFVVILVVLPHGCFFFFFFFFFFFLFFLLLLLSSRLWLLLPLAYEAMITTGVAACFVDSASQDRTTVKFVPPHLPCTSKRWCNVSFWLDWEDRIMFPSHGTHHISPLHTMLHPKSRWSLLIDMYTIRSTLEKKVTKHKQAAEEKWKKHEKNMKIHETWNMKKDKHVPCSQNLPCSGCFTEAKPSWVSWHPGLRRSRRQATAGSVCWWSSLRQWKWLVVPKRAGWIPDFTDVFKHVQTFLAKQVPCFKRHEGGGFETSRANWLRDIKETFHSYLLLGCFARWLDGLELTGGHKEKLKTLVLALTTRRSPKRSGVWRSFWERDSGVKTCQKPWVEDLLHGISNNYTTDSDCIQNSLNMF